MLLTLNLQFFILIFFKFADTTFLGSDDICLTRECVETAGDVFRNMDETVDPCHDFYRFSCGNYIKHSLISNDKTFANTFTVINDVLQEQIKISLEENTSANEPKPFALVKKYYRACKNKSEYSRMKTRFRI